MLDWEIKRIESAETVKDYSGWLYDPYAGKWFEDEESWCDHYANTDSDPPEYVFAATKHYFQIDIESVLEDEAENHLTENEYDIVEYVVGLDELRSFIDAWNKKQTDAYTWTEDYKHKVYMGDCHEEIMEQRAKK